MPDVTPWDWMLAANAVVSNMAHWEEVGRSPAVLMGDPKGDLSRCGCEGDGSPKGGQVLVTAGDVFYTGEQFPDPDILRRKFSVNCPDQWAVEVTVEFARCRPVFAADGRSQPSASTIATHAEALYEDGWAIWSALRCALPTWRQEIHSAVVRGWGPIQRDLGPCGGYSYSFVGKVDACIDCDPAP
jgi:hypothetical protein